MFATTPSMWWILRHPPSPVAARVGDFADQLPSVVSMAEDILGDGIVASLASSIFAAAAKLACAPRDELKGIAKASGVPLGRVVLLQIAYGRSRPALQLSWMGQKGIRSTFTPWTGKCLNFNH